MLWDWNGEGRCMESGSEGKEEKKEKVTCALFIF